MQSVRTSWLIGAAVAAALTVGACSAKVETSSGGASPSAAGGGASTSAAPAAGTIDVTKIQTSVDAEMASKMGVTVSSLSCPNDIPIQAGGTFTCTATAGDSSTPISITVTQTDANGTVSWALVDTTAPVPKVEQAIKDQSAAQTGLTLSGVQCPTLVVAKVGYMFNCTITAADGSTQKVTVTISNENGDVTWKAAS